MCQGNPSSDEAGGGLARAVPPGQRRRLPASGRPAVRLRPRGAAHRHVPLQVPPDAPDPDVQGAGALLSGWLILLACFVFGDERTLRAT